MILKSASFGGRALVLQCLRRKRISAGVVYGRLINALVAVSRAGIEDVQLEFSLQEMREQVYGFLVFTPAQVPDYLPAAASLFPCISCGSGDAGGGVRGAGLCLYTPEYPGFYLSENLI